MAALNPIAHCEVARGNFLLKVEQMRESHFECFQGILSNSGFKTSDTMSTKIYKSYKDL